MRIGFKSHKRLLIVAIIMVCFSAAAYIGLSTMNNGPIPTMLALRGISMLEKYLPIEIEIESAHFQGPLRLVLSNVDISTAQVDGISRMHTAEVYLDFNLLSVLQGNHLAGLQQIQLIAPDVSMEYGTYLEYVQPSVAPQTPSASKSQQTSPTPTAPKATMPWPELHVQVHGGHLQLEGAGAPGTLKIDANVSSSKQEIKVKRLHISRGAGQLQASGVLRTSGEISAQAKVTDWLLLDALAWYPQFTVAGRGTLYGHAQVNGTLLAPEVTAQVGLRNAKLALPDTMPTQYLVLNKAETSLKTSPEGWQVSNLEVITPTGKLTGAGQIVDQRLQINVAAENIALPADIPVVAAWGIEGSAAFTGEIAGTLSQPVLSGRVVMGSSQLWHQHVDSVSGLLSLTLERMQFDQVQVRKGEARYQLQGALSQLSTGDPVIDGRLSSVTGRAEDLLAVLELPMEATGELDGTLTFQGPFSHVVTAGNVTIKDAQLYGESLEWAQGGFRWGDGQLALQDVRARSYKGELQVDGTAALDGSSLNMTLHVADWPLERIEHLQQLAAGWRGTFSFQGDLQGSITVPKLQGTVDARNLQLGKVEIATLSGPLTFAAGNLRSSGLVAHTKQGGNWRLAGQISEVVYAPQFDLNLAVENESLSALLAMGGYRIPAALIDGAVNGSVDLSGPIDGPQAHLQLYLAEQGLPVYHGLQLELRIANRRVNIIRIGA